MNGLAAAGGDQSSTRQPRWRSRNATSCRATSATACTLDPLARLVRLRGLARAVVDGGDPERLQRRDVGPGLLRPHLDARGARGTP